MWGFVLVRHLILSRVNNFRLIPVKFNMAAPNFNHLGLVLNPRTQLSSQFALTQYLNKGLGCAATDL